MARSATPLVSLLPQSYYENLQAGLQNLSEQCVPRFVSGAYVSTDTQLPRDGHDSRPKAAAAGQTTGRTGRQLPSSPVLMGRGVLIPL